MNRLFGRLRPGKMAVAKQARDSPAVSESRPHAVASGFAIARNMHHKPGPTWTMEAVSKERLPHDAEKEFFHFTRGRFVHNEQHELSQRHRTFNVAELARHAAHAVQADRCLRVTKCPDGMYNRVLLFSMDNGKEVIAKIPNPNSGRPHFTTASEVATMEFAREVLGNPVPQVYAWSSRAQETLVGAEFILMEKINGMELEHFFPAMKIQDRLEVMKTVARYQQSWASVSFEQFGSLYFAEDVGGSAHSPLTYLDHDGRKVTDSRFVVGPSTGREMFDDGREDIEFDRGPWKSLEDYHIAIGKRELACVQHISQLPPSPVSLRGPGLYQPTREKKVKALETYLKLLKHLLPTDSSLRSAHLWHGDLHGGNIFVDPTNPTQVVGLIDWQCIELSPLYFRARQPHFIDHEGPTTHGLERPPLPPNYDRLEASEKREAKALYLDQSLCALYRIFVNKICPKIYACFEFQESSAFMLLLLARNILIDGEAAYMVQACELKDDDEMWETLTGGGEEAPGTTTTAFPLSFSPTELQTIEADMERAEVGMAAMRHMREILGEELFPRSGYVSFDRYQEAVDAIRQTRELVLAELTGK